MLSVTDGVVKLYDLMFFENCFTWDGCGGRGGDDCFTDTSLTQFDGLLVPSSSTGGCLVCEGWVGGDGGREGLDDMLSLDPLLLFCTLVSLF